MLDAGIVYCQNCGQTFRGFYYQNGATGLTVLLKKNLVGKYFVSPVYKNGENPTYKKIYLAQSIDRNTNVFRRQINVTAINSSNTTLTYAYNRICPNCKTILQNYELGTAPTYIVPVIGEPKIGKSCWISGITVQENLNKINEAARISGSAYYLDAAGQTSKTSIQKTAVNDFGETRLVYIKNRENHKLVAALLLMDFAGELFTKEYLDEFYTRIVPTTFSKNGGYKGIDAVIFMDGADRPSDSLVQVYNQVRDTRLLEGRPVAYVLNKLDVCFRQLPVVKLSNSNKTTFLFDERTFKPTSDVSMSRDALTHRISLQTYITRKMKSTAETIFTRNADSAGFIIKTGDPDGLEIDLSASINVLDPLLWLLNKLDIFPIN